MIRVTVWNEYKHEREFEAIRQVYPEGIHGCIAAFLREEEDFTVRTTTFEEPEHGLTEEVLCDTDVLIFWSHALQEEFSDEVAERVQRHVLAGMGLIALHSAHFSKVMKKLMGTTMTLKWQHGQQENLWCIAPGHPIAAGVPEKISLAEEEMYGEYFDIPKPDEVIFAGWFSGGQVFRSGCTFTRGRGKIFYFQPGHEEYPIYYKPEIQQIIKNAVRFCTPDGNRWKLVCEEVKA
ncbi:MAG: ThuA domain-containing protein [Roseburia sp.]